MARDLESLDTDSLLQMAGLSGGSTQESQDETQDKQDDLESLSTEELMQRYEQVSTIKPEKKEISFVEEAIKKPAIEVTRGLLKGSKSFTDTLSGSQKVLESLTEPAGQGAQTAGLIGKAAELSAQVLGRETTPQDINFFQKMSDNTQAMLEVMPETDMPAVARVPYEIAGQMPGVAAEFLLARRILEPVSALSKLPVTVQNKLTEVGSFGLVQAVKEFDKDEDMQSFAKGFASGATVGGAFEVGSLGARKVFDKAIDLSAKYGKQVGRLWLRSIMKDKKLVDQFMDNPQKYIINRIGQMSTGLKERMKNKVSTLKDRAKEQQSVINTQTQARTQKIMNGYNSRKEAVMKDYDDKIFELRTANSDKVATINEASKENIKNAKSDMEEVVASRLANTYQKAVDVKKQYGKAVGDAIEDMSTVNPLVGINKVAVEGRFNKAIKDAGFQWKNGKLRPTAYTPDESDLKVLDSFTEHYNSLKNQKISSTFTDFGTGRKVDVKLDAEGFTLKYLQDVKNQSRGLAEKYYKGDKNLGKLYQNLSEAMNPANMIDDIPELKNKLIPLKEANAVYSSAKKKYENYMGKFFKQEPSGEVVANVQPVVAVLNRGDKVALARMKEAEKILPESDRVVSTIESLFKDFKNIESKQKTIMRKGREKASRTLKDLQREKKEALKELNIKKTKLQSSVKQKEAEDIIAKVDTLQEKMLKIEDSYNKRISKFEEEEELSKFLPDLAITRRLQNIFEIGAFANLSVGQVAKSLNFLAGAAGLSPFVASNTIKGMSNLKRNLKDYSQSKLREYMAAAAKRDGTKASRLKEVIVERYDFPEKLSKIVEDRFA